MRLTAFGIACAALIAAAAPARADDPEDFSFHGQTTFVDQYHPRFHADYTGPNSLNPGNRGDETFDATLFLGLKLWQGGAVYADPEIDQGFGLSGTLGVAGFPSGEAYKVGADDPYFRLQRLFVRQSVDLGGETQTIAPDANQLGGAKTADNLIVTIGKFAVTDVFDTNAYAHDPRGDFLNWALIDAGAFDYAADAWGYSAGAAVEWTQDWWTLRGGLFDLSTIPNSKTLDSRFSQFEMVGEFEARQTWFGGDGKIKLLGFLNRGRMGSYDAALRLAQATGNPPDTALVRRYNSKAGASLNIEQPLGGNWGAFARASLNDGSQEAFEFTEINRSLSAGVSLKGADWDRAKDTLGAAFVVNGLSRDARDYFAAGGLGLLIGDGRLPNAGSEDILEAYYSAELRDGIAASADYQFIANPAYNRDRGPVSVLGLRLHGEF
ncbi:MAG TPA: carbohydrate porin [Rhizomicrobium sp.]|jgi:high affinity Mn2+ porin|nr:carbohydrate porin [Rhizomicrobium sp.]